MSAILKGVGALAQFAPLAHQRYQATTNHVGVMPARPVAQDQFITMAKDCGFWQDLNQANEPQQRTRRDGKMTKDAIITIKPLYLAREQAAMYLSISDSMLDKLVAQGDAPKPRRISAGRTAWLVDELDAWGRARPVSDFVPPINSGHGRAGKPT
ncbi:MAG: AlpA family phage regulatory protein [Hylemonella sp.]|jgi:prophage regulatory protein|nr:AlpA family phage regulatory protein [Hylemonella sp.]